MTKILIIDDNESWGKIIYDYIILKKQLVDEAKIVHNGREAIEYIKKHSVDIILLDLDLPYVNGVDIINCYKKYINNIIIMTGKPELISTINFGSYDSVGKILIKPFDLSVLEIEIKFCLKHSILEIIENKVDDIINEIAINNDRIGYKYLKICIIEGYKNIELTENLQEKLYEKVANRLSLKSSKKIKWNVEKIIKEIMENSQSKIIEDNFPNRLYVTPKKFIKKIISIL